MGFISILHRLLIAFLLFVVLVGCGTITTNNITPIATQFSQPTTEFEDSLERAPTFTALPSSTPFPGATPNQAETAIVRTIDSVQSAEQTLVARYPRICKDIYAPRKYSPDKLWLEELCYSKDDQSLILTLSNRDSQVLWKLDYQDYIQQGDVLPDGGLAVVYWSNDGGYAYFSSYISGSGGECFISGNALNYGKGLFRLDLETGEIATILPLRENFAGYDFSFSPTGRRLVYDTYSLGVNILDIKTGKLVKIIPVSEFNGGGSYLWSSDGLEFVYSTVSYNEISEPIAYSVRLVDAQSGSEYILLESTRSCYASRVWRENRILIIESYDENYDRTLIEYDLSLNRIISEATETPRP